MALEDLLDRAHGRGGVLACDCVLHLLEAHEARGGEDPRHGDQGPEQPGALVARGSDHDDLGQVLPAVMAVFGPGTGTEFPARVHRLIHVRHRSHRTEPR